ncbi:unnamed protein product [Ectocarpus sp. 12 AP-2014]
MGREGFSVRGGGFRFCVHDHPPHPQASDPIVIEVLGSDTHNTGILRHICAAMAATADDCQHNSPVAA